MDDLVCFILSTSLDPDEAPRLRIGEGIYPRFFCTVIIQRGWVCVSYVNRERDRNRKVEEGTSRSYKHELFIFRGFLSGKGSAWIPIK